MPIGRNPRFGALSKRRLQSDSYLDCAKSIGALNDETFNVWSHFIGALLFSASAVRFTLSCPNPLPGDARIILRYLVAATSCFSFSTLYHLFANHAQASLWQRIDHLGIVTVIWASSMSLIIFSFRCEYGTQRAYVAIVTVLAVLSLFRIWRSHPADRWGRIATHIAFGGSATLPAVHLLYRETSEIESSLLRAF
ncbi:hypothetical protein BU26DRAFT_442843 [Trematosphaeria pertusa]|uniref:Hly-III related protein n=1 Tax=Trematosphaeria pertusa TaxID=390896 RepID=A0A6A6HRB4_9PLEO|nr:uncharacterized protein BU26DRAFT_442843 [Trematosphaeria pertusa]KAF2240348.1 hypothetical protein BU26DRAFT_442843 [Trematosphaeria pertusa]